MSRFLFTLPEFYNSYKVWVSENPQLASDLESTVKWISYFIAGRVNNSNILAELVFSLSNLLVLFNDRIISHARNLQPHSSGDKLRILLTVVEYLEVFVEVTAHKAWGSRAKWMVILALQLSKCIAKLTLLVLHKDKTIRNPPVPPLKRNKLTEKEKKDIDTSYNFNSATFTLERSGRLIRRISTAPPPQCRNWKPPLQPPNNNIGEEHEEEETDEYKLLFCRDHFIAEVLYIIKPLLHLSSIARWGTKAWKPWLFALTMDLASLRLYKRPSSNGMKLYRSQKLELSRRTIGMLLYILRSPFYDKYSKNPIQSLLYMLSNNIPLARILCIPLIHYIPVWQKTYFYLWST